MSVIILGIIGRAFNAIITEAYAPILGTAVVGGLIIGWIVGKFGKGEASYANEYIHLSMHHPPFPVL